jgi:hypothetical protein
MFNVEQITARLATLPDPALQQYAMMHKADPYIMALAMSESKRRKHLRAASQGAPVPEQPKIVDQAVSDMAPPQSPDDAGIASLPTQEMNFADGGIVAFAGGGDTYETPYDRMNRPRCSTEFHPHCIRFGNERVGDLRIAPFDHVPKPL